MSDLIDRRAAIDAVMNTEPVVFDVKTLEPHQKTKDVIKALEQLSSVQRTGWWIEDAESYYKAVNDKGGGVDENTPYFTDDIACSECLSLFSVIDNETERFNYCPNCGAKMEVEHETD